MTMQFLPLSQLYVQFASVSQKFFNSKPLLDAIKHCIEYPSTVTIFDDETDESPRQGSGSFPCMTELLY